MSFHKNPKYQIPALIESLKAHGLEHDTPSQLADAFRFGWLSAVAEPAQSSELWPNLLPLRVVVSYSPGDWDTFIYGVSGHLTMSALDDIQSQITGEDNESLFDRGPGDYLLGASHFKGQYGPEGQCEFAPGWELWVEDFRPLAANQKEGKA